METTTMPQQRRQEREHLVSTTCCCNGNIVLVTGPSGCGKSTFATELATQMMMFEQQRRRKRQHHHGRRQEDIKVQEAKGTRAKEEVDVVRVFHQDDYFTKEFLPYEQRIDDSYEDDSGINWEKLLQDVRQYLLQAAVSTTTTTSSSLSLLQQRQTFDQQQQQETGHHHLLHVPTTATAIIEGHMIASIPLYRWKELLLLQVNNDNTCPSRSPTTPSSSSSSSSSLSRLCVFFLNTTQEICKQRRLYRSNRSKEEYDILSKYIDTYVWPSYLKYGLPTIQQMKRDILLSQHDDEKEDGDATITMLKWFELVDNNNNNNHSNNTNNNDSNCGACGTTTTTTTSRFYHCCCDDVDDDDNEGTASSSRSIEDIVQDIMLH